MGWVDLSQATKSPKTILFVILAYALLKWFWMILLSVSEQRDQQCFLTAFSLCKKGTPTFYLDILHCVISKCSIEWSLHTHLDRQFEYFDRFKKQSLIACNKVVSHRSDISYFLTRMVICKRVYRSRQRLAAQLLFDYNLYSSKLLNNLFFLHLLASLSWFLL